MKSHLTDEALDDVLIGIGSAASHAHLNECAECRARVESIQSTVTLFNQASTRFSDARPLKPLPKVKFVDTRHRIVRPVFAAWAAVAALLVMSLPTAWHIIAPHPVHAPAIATESQDSESQIEEDNKLLRQVNDALAAPDEQSVMDEYQLLDGSVPRVHPTMRTE